MKYLRNGKVNITTVFFLVGIFISFSFSAFQSEEKEKPVFQFLNQDSVLISVIGVLDKDNHLTQYKSRVKTPVCERKVCYDVELIFYWNLVGDFVKYELIPGVPLTKRQHEPFTDADYQKLSELLADKAPAFPNFKKDELVSKVGNNIDATSGATITVVKGQTIEGAIYSCYTLWQIANREVVELIRQHTVKKLEKKVVQNIGAINTQDANYFLVDNFKKADFISYSATVQDLIKRSKGYFAKNAIEKMPDEMFSRLELQTFFSEQYYNHLDYFAQTALLERLQNKPIVNQLALTLIQNLNTDQYQNKLVVHLLLANIDNLEDATMRVLLQKIKDNPLVVDDDIYKQIISVSKKRKLL